jgi:hypothetical protein
MTVDKMTVDKMTVDKMTVDKMSVDEMSIDEMTCCRPEWKGFKTINVTVTTIVTDEKFPEKKNYFSLFL